MKHKFAGLRQIVQILREAEGADSAREVTGLRRDEAMAEENARLKKLVAEQALKISLLEEANAKKMVSPLARRKGLSKAVIRRRLAPVEQFNFSFHNTATG